MWCEAQIQEWIEFINIEYGTIVFLSVYTAYSRNRGGRGVAWLGGGGGSRPPPAGGGGRMSDAWKGRHSIYKRLV